ncbi:hypothetical protein GQ600_10963 [Phytophthora cactorum]|nr:hypothetical protein GQ600_10963 [Phytophthora cactorum]
MAMEVSRAQNLKAGGQMSTSDLTVSTSASTNFLSREPRAALLAYGRKQRLERKFVKKLVVRRAMEKPNVRFYIEKFIESVLQMCFYPSSGATPAVVALD